MAETDDLAAKWVKSFNKQCTSRNPNGQQAEARVQLYKYSGKCKLNLQ